MCTCNPSPVIAPQFTPVPRKSTGRPSHRGTRPFLTVALATTLLIGTGHALAAPHSSVPSRTVVQTRGHSQADLVKAIHAFGQAAIHGPDAAINGFATPALRKRAPGGHLINLFGPAQNPPSRYTFTVDSFGAGLASVTITFPYNPSTTLTDRLTWIDSNAGWKIADIQYQPTDLDLHQMLLQTAAAFGRAVRSGTDGQINSFATPALLRRAPAGHLVNLFGLGNRPQDAFVRGIRINGHSAWATLVFNFGERVTVSRASTWTYAHAGWKLAAIDRGGRG